MTASAAEMGDELAARLSNYPPAMVRHFVPILLIRTRTDLSRLPPPLDAVMRSFAEESGLSKAKTETECLEAILRFYDKRPIAPELRALLREVVGGGLNRNAWSRDHSDDARPTSDRIRMGAVE